MKTKTIVSALIVSFALMGAAQAATPRGDSDNQPFQGNYGQTDSSSASRSQVEAELQQAQGTGIAALGDTDNIPFAMQSDPASSSAQADSQPSPVILGDSDNVPFEGA